MKRLYNMAQLRLIVDKFHVGTPDNEIEEVIRERTKKWPVGQQNSAVKDAIKIHHRNIGLYRDVMGGTLGMKKNRKSVTEEMENALDSEPEVTEPEPEPEVEPEDRGEEEEEGPKEFTEEDARAAIEEIGVDPEEIDLGQLVKGMNVELEHGSKNADLDITGDDPVATAKIALAHIRETDDYYDLLADMEARGKEEEGEEGYGEEGGENEFGGEPEGEGEFGGEPEGENEFGGEREGDFGGEPGGDFGGEKEPKDKEDTVEEKLSRVLRRK